MSKEKYLLFKNHDDANYWLRQNYDEFFEEIYLKGKHKDLYFAISNYTGSLSKNYNILLSFSKGEINADFYNYLEQYCVDDKESILEYSKDISILYNSFNFVLPENIILLHYLDNKFYKYKFKRGEYIFLNKFISTTLIDNADVLGLGFTNHHNLLIKIYTKKGTKCLPVGNDPNYCLKEYEIILHPKTKLLVKRKGFDFKRFIKFVECEVVD